MSAILKVSGGVYPARRCALLGARFSYKEDRIVDHADLPTAGRDRPDPALVLAALRSRRLQVELREAQIWVRAVTLGETLASPMLGGLVNNQVELTQVIETVEKAFIALNGHVRPC